MPDRDYYSAPLRDASEAELADELDVVLEAIVDGDLLVTPTTRALATAELALRRYGLRSGPPPAELEHELEGVLATRIRRARASESELERLERDARVRHAMTRSLSVAELAGGLVGVALVVAALAGVVLALVWALVTLWGVTT